MVRAVCCSGEFVQPVAGRPGAGQDLRARSGRRRPRRRGRTDHRLRRVGDRGRRARTCGRVRPLDRRSSIDRRAAALGPRRPALARPGSRDGRGGVDEASMLGTRDLARLAAHVRVRVGRSASSATPTSTARSMSAASSAGCAPNGATGWSGWSTTTVNRTTPNGSRSPSTATATSPTRSAATTRPARSSGHERRGSPSTRSSPTGTPPVCTIGSIR